MTLSAVVFFVVVFPVTNLHHAVLSQMHGAAGPQNERYGISGLAGHAAEHVVAVLRCNV